MNNLKYRSVMSVIGLSMLAVFLFTGCEKDTAVAPNSESHNMIEKFKRLKFQTVTTSEKESGNNFADNNNNGSSDFVRPSSGGDAQFAPNSGQHDMFTDPSSTDTEFFGVNGMFGFGGGNFNFKGKNHDIAFGFCGSDIFGELDGDLENVDIFIGVAGDWAMDDGENEPEEGYIIYAVSYNGSTNISNFHDLDEGTNIQNMAFVILIEFNNSNNGGEMYYSTAGNLTFGGSNVSLAGVNMVDMEGKNVGKIDASLECVNAFDFDLSVDAN